MAEDQELRENLMEGYEGEDDVQADFVLAFKFYDKIFEDDDKMNKEQLEDLEDDVFRISLVGQSWNLDDKPLDVKETWNKAKNYDEYKRHIENILEKKCHLKVAKKTTDEHEMFLITTTEDFLYKEADRVNYKLRFHSEYDQGMSKNCQGWANFETELQGVKVKPYDECDESERIFETHDDGKTKSYFRQVDRIRLIYSSINKYMNLSQAALWNICRNFVPHNVQELKKLNEQWINYNPCKKLPIPDVRNYYGEQISLYFQWTEMLQWWLIFPAIVGLLATIGSAMFGGISALNELEQDIAAAADDSDETPNPTAEEIADERENAYIVSSINLLYSVILIAWAVMFNEYWKRKQARLTLEWGTETCEEDQEPRAEFIGEKKINPINDRKERLFSEGLRSKRQAVGVTVAVLFIVLTVIIVLAIFLYKASVTLSDQYTDEEKTMRSYIAGGLNSFQIKIMNFLYQKCAVCMTNWENYRTQIDYNDALYGKIFVFQFVNSFVSLYYIAFIKEHQEGCTNSNCTEELSIQLLMLFVMFIGFNALEIGMPLLFKWQAERTQVKKERLESEVDMSSGEADADYLELMICFGYLTLFTASLPLAPLLAYIAVLIEIKVDAYKYGKLIQRPFPRLAKDIGVWQGILRFMVLAAVVTNVGLILLTDNKLQLSQAGMWGGFIIVEHLVLGLVALIEGVIPDESAETADLRKRHEHIVQSKYYGIVDDD